MNRSLGSMGLERILTVFLVLGSLMICFGVYREIRMSNEVEVEFLEKSTVKNLKILVDIQGAVIHPGVYELSENSRIKDVLVASGGLSAVADRDYVSKVFNLADKVKDGQKIYIPEINSIEAGGGSIEAKSQIKCVNINTATTEELDTLWGIGSSRANDIINARPYQKVEDLTGKGVISKGVLDRNRERLCVY